MSTHVDFCARMSVSLAHARTCLCMHAYMSLACVLGAHTMRWQDSGFHLCLAFCVLFSVCVLQTPRRVMLGCRGSWCWDRSPGRAL